MIDGDLGEIRNDFWGRVPRRVSIDSAVCVGRDALEMVRDAKWEILDVCRACGLLVSLKTGEYTPRITRACASSLYGQPRREQIAICNSFEIRSKRMPKHFFEKKMSRDFGKAFPLLRLLNTLCVLWVCSNAKETKFSKFAWLIDDKNSLLSKILSVGRAAVCKKVARENGEGTKVNYERGWWEERRKRKKERTTFSR